MIEVEALTKRYGTTNAVDGLSFTAPAGSVTGFLGPNGAGKSTTMRMVVGLERPTSGRALVHGRRYRDLRAPLHEVGSMLDARSVHPGRSAFAHLLAMARTHGISRARVMDVIEQTGLASVARRRAGTFSLGMGQRLGVAAALLGDPAVLILDEPVNGLDPDGVLWVRALVRGLADEGRTVLLSSHLMHELALCADRVVIIGQGRLLAEQAMTDVVADAGRGTVVRVRTPQAALLAEELRREGAEVSLDVVDGAEDTLLVHGWEPDRVGASAQRCGATISELIRTERSLEDAYLELTAGATQYRSRHDAGSRR